MPLNSVLLFLIAALLAGCGRKTPSVTQSVTLKPSTSADCRSCHEEIFRSWADSHHALAHRSVDATKDATAFTPSRNFSQHGVDYQIAWNDGRPDFSEKHAARPVDKYGPEFALGHTPLRQYVVPVGGGRYQVAELAFDPARSEWFDVFGDEQRQPGEWGHWRGRGMNWNSMCAHCHLTDFRKNYDAAADTYASTWREQGIGCAQCHGELPAEHAQKKKGVPPADPAARARAQETCAPCHARNELLTGTVQPGVPYTDHYRLTLPTDAAIFYPDGQMRDEDFNYTSFLTSRMGGKAGITCLDCHDPHSGRPRLPVENNALCLQCHAAATKPNIPVIDPVAHSHHAADSAGNRCVSCHMPTTTYMQRDPRHDHGFLRPDPLLTKELGIPNACARCHSDQTVDWAIAATDRWYGAKMESRQRVRTRGVVAAQAGAADAADTLTGLLATEDIPAWKATLLELARPFANTSPGIVAAARVALQDPEPLVRSAAVQVLGANEAARLALTPVLKDPSRLARLDAEWALSDRLAENSPERKELNAYLAVMADQPAGQARLGEDFFNRGRMVEAEAALRKATEWDQNSPGLFLTLGTVLNSLGRDAEAAAAFWRAAQTNHADANAAFSAALAFAGAGKLADAEMALRETVRRDPSRDRAWYNLGLLLAQAHRGADALQALGEAERLAPSVADYPYARATILWQSGDRAGTATAARRTLAIDPAHREAPELLRRAEAR